jgi:hypothetical protein
VDELVADGCEVFEATIAANEVLVTGVLLLLTVGLALSIVELELLLILSLEELLFALLLLLLSLVFVLLLEERSLLLFLLLDQFVSRFLKSIHFNCSRNI